MTHPVSDAAIRRFFRAQATGWAGQADPPNPWETNPVRRTRELFRTSRRYGINEEAAGQHWNNTLQPILNDLHQTPTSENEYDPWLQQKAATFSGILEGKLGLAQKVLNLFMKDLWGWEILPVEINPLLHVPVDRIILSKLTQAPPAWEAWTEVVVEDDAQFNDRWVEYMEIQTTYRTQARHLGFKSTLAMEQIIWGRFS